MSNRPGGPARQRPGTATAAGVLATLCGGIAFGGGAYGALRTAWWISEAEPGENRWIGDVLGIVFCLIAVAMGSIMLRRGPELLRGRVDGLDRLENQFVLLMICSGIAMLNGLFDTNLPRGEWWARMAVFAGLCGMSVAVLLLCGARATKTYLGIRR